MKWKTCESARSFLCKNKDDLLTLRTNDSPCISTYILLCKLICCREPVPCISSCMEEMEDLEGVDRALCQGASSSRVSINWQVPIWPSPSFHPDLTSIFSVCRLTQQAAQNSNHDRENQDATRTFAGILSVAPKPDTPSTSTWTRKCHALSTCNTPQRALAETSHDCI